MRTPARALERARAAARRRRTSASRGRAARTRRRAGRRSCARSSEPTWTNAGLLELRRSVDRREALEVDARVDDLGLAARLGQPLLELAPQVVRDGDHRRRALDDLPGQARDARDGADVPDVAPVRRDDERRVDLRREEAGTGRGSAPRRRRARGASRTRRRSSRKRRLPPARRSSTARSTSCPRSRSTRTCCSTNEPRSGSAGPGYICETTRIFTPCGRRAATGRAPACGRRWGRSRAG